MKKYIVALLLSINGLCAIETKQEMQEVIKTLVRVPSLSNQLVTYYYCYYRENGKQYRDLLEVYHGRVPFVAATHVIAERPASY